MAVLALVLGISALGVGAGGMPWADDESAAADGYPLRVERPYVVRELPARPGALAGLLKSSDGSWMAVSPHGRVWELADEDDRFEVFPALSADGRILAYLRTSKDGFGEYVIRNLKTGVLTAYPELSSSATGSDATFWIAPQQPAHLSPGGDQVLLQGGRADGRNADALVLSEDGGVRELFVAGPVFPAGWLPDGRIAWLAQPDGFLEPTRSPEIVVTTDTGVEEGRARLHLTRPMDLSQWSMRISPDGTSIALAEDAGPARTVAIVPSGDWREQDRWDVAADTVLGGCLTSWRDEQPMVSTTTGLAPPDPSEAPVLAADPRLQVGCSVWAQQAIDGDAHQGLSGDLFDTSDSWWAWRWREVAAAILLVVAVAGLWWARRRLRPEPEVQTLDE